MTLTLQRTIPPAADICMADEVYFVLQRANGHWSPAAKIVTVFATEQIAEAYAAQQKKLHPQQNFGVAVLRSEAREVAQPIEIVRVEKH